MFGLGIHYLNGWAMAAADGPKKERAEWPPHPDRVFMALAAGWFETDQDVAEGDALRWLEQLPPPGISASDATQRFITVSFVPVNDSANPIAVKYEKGVRKEKSFAIMGLFPIGRDRQPRTFPTAIPHDPIVHLIWDEDLPQIHREPLTRLCGKVVSIGHPASLVQMWVTDSPPAPTLVVRDGIARQRLRVFGQGRLDDLSKTCGKESHIARADELWEQEQAATGTRRNQLKKSREASLYGIVERLRPHVWGYAGYDKPPVVPKKQIRGGIFDPRLVILSLSGKRLSLPSTLRLTQALRGALMAGTQPPLPEWLSGHASDGRRSEQPHVAFIPLPFVGREHADGRLLGVALALPRSISQSEAAYVLGHWLHDHYELPRRHRLFDGKWFECAVELETRESPPWNLRVEAWTSPARAWASVTPVVLDRHFDGKDKWEQAAEHMKDACVRVGLPRPQEILLHPVSMFEGVPRSTEFPPLIRKKDGGRMHHAHAVIVFEEEIEGPVLVGAGRYRGYGVCRPLLRGDNDHA